MSLKKHSVCMYVVFALLVLFTFGVSVGYTADCVTSSGSKCTVSCSIGTATAVCSSNSRNCSTSCSDSSGNMQDNLIESLRIVAADYLDEEEARDLLMEYFSDVLNFHGDHTAHTEFGTITIDVD